MKLFMEVNPTLFDECSHEYTESQNNAKARKQERQDKWDKLSQIASAKYDGKPLPKTLLHSSRGIQGPSLSTSPNKIFLTEIEGSGVAIERDNNADRLAALDLTSELLALEDGGQSPRAVMRDPLPMGTAS